jgi:hypothetical protein
MNVFLAFGLRVFGCFGVCFMFANLFIAHGGAKGIDVHITG